MRAKRLFCFLLAAVLCAVLLAGCDSSDTKSSEDGGQGSSAGQTSGTASTGSDGAGNEESVIPDELIEDYFEGQTIRVFTAAFNDSYVTEIGDNSNNENCAKVLSVAIMQRTEAVEEAYGVQIEEVIQIDPKRYNGSFLTAVREYAFSGTWEYDILSIGCRIIDETWEIKK